jgi:hypothetical protein
VPVFLPAGGGDAFKLVGIKRGLTGLNLSSRGGNKKNGCYRKKYASHVINIILFMMPIND